MNRVSVNLRTYDNRAFAEFMTRYLERQVAESKKPRTEHRKCTNQSDGLNEQSQAGRPAAG